MDIASNNLIHAVDELVNRGYDYDFRLSEGTLFDVTNNSNIETDDFGVDAAYRFEAAPGSDDCSNLYGISTRSGGTKDLLIDAFDLYQNQANASLLERLDVQSVVSAYDNSDDEPMKNGVPKILKDDFNEDPDRYVLRKGFPDFPECPFGNSFSMLGYDNIKERYVWLVTSILKDERLDVEIY